MELARPRPELPRATPEISLVALGSGLLRWRKRIVALAVTGGILGLLSGLLSHRTYVATASIVPQTTDSPASGLAAAASQFGIKVPGSGTGWGPPVYARLLVSPSLLEPVLLDTLVVAEENGRRAAVLDLLEIPDGPRPMRIERGLDALRLMVGVQEMKALGAVDITVRSRWPSVSFAIATQLIRGVNQFNVQRRRTEAGAERVFADSVATTSERLLRDAEDRLQNFMQQNRVYASSPELALQRERLQRDVALRQQVYTTLVQAREDARLREVRSTPVLTVLEPPRLPVRPEGRRSVLKAILGGLAGMTIGILLALVAQAFGRARHTPDEETREFLDLLDQTVPRFLKRRRV
ncbi:MAG: lipopolysaccharide biosynthesis protein [Gemmatimonadetes bacterium]|nr:lipopolysaccharide biosynthesis protein [Gemmatimonadota bacterium]